MAPDQAEWWCQVGEALDSLAEDNDYPWINAGRTRVRQDLAAWSPGTSTPVPGPAATPMQAVSYRRDQPTRGPVVEGA